METIIEAKTTLETYCPQSEWWAGKQKIDKKYKQLLYRHTTYKEKIKQLNLIKHFGLSMICFSCSANILHMSYYINIVIIIKT